MKGVKIGLGILVSLLFLFMAFRKVEWIQMKRAVVGIRWGYAAGITLVVLLSDWLRAVRWKYLMAPIRPLDSGSLFNALIIGYAANACLPAHLGEFLRAYVISRKRHVPASAAFATIVTERILDMFSLLAMMLLAIVLYPFPDWIKKSGWVMFAGTAGLFLFMVFLKVRTAKTLAWVRRILRPFPARWTAKVESMLQTFLTGFVALRGIRDYIWVAVLTPAIWLCYCAAFWSAFRAFGFDMPREAPVVLLVITTIGIVVPSSPGYVGTYHWLCQFGLGLYGIPKSPALAFALVHHGMNVIPFFLLGLVLAWKEGVSLVRTKPVFNGAAEPGVVP
jgi:hypothetical protein